MLKHLALFLLFAFSVLADDKAIPTANIDGGVSTIVGGCVSAITGDYLEAAVDLNVAGPEPLVFERFYASSDYTTTSLYTGWKHNYDSYIKLNDQNKYQAIYLENSGRSARYHKQISGRLNLDAKTSFKGLTNCGNGPISSHTNARNIGINIHGRKDPIQVFTGDGTKREFLRNKTNHTHLLQKETRPNGLHTFYSYRNEKQIVDQVSLGKDSNIFSWIKIVDVPSDDESHPNPTVEISASDGTKVTYKLQKFQKGIVRDLYRITEVQRSHAPNQTYEYETREGSTVGRIVKRSNPDGRYLSIEYYRKENDIGGTSVTLKKSDPRLHRVMLLKAPVGHDLTPIITHRFFYDVKQNENELQNGTTIVYDAYNHKTTYEYSKEHRLERLKKYTGTQNPALYSTEWYHWSPTGELTGKCLLSPADQVITTRLFEYDGVGNVLCEKLCGTITGAPSGDCYATYYAYTQDAFHLLLAKTEGNGRGERYAYHHNSNLVSTKLVIAADKIVTRTFYEYDNNSVLTKTIIDDGNTVDKNDLTGVTERRITYIYPRTTPPVGVPERVDEIYLDRATGQEVLLKRSFTAFSPQGRPLKQDCYDAGGVYRYSLFWEYDAHGNVTKETDALGQTIQRTYDANDNLISETTPACRRLYAYDFSNRLIRVEEIDSDGTQLITLHTYDYLGNRISTTDPSGNKTEFIYDEFGRVIMTFYPPVPSSNGTLVNTGIQKAYDILGNVTTHIDPRGEQTHTSYNIQGKPLTIRYPDGTQESYEYNLDGTPRKAIAKNGSITTYVHDPLGRLLQEELYSPQGELLGRSTWTYNGFHLISSTDPEGHVTTYTYDGAGRKSSVATANSLTTFEYDSLGRPHKTTTDGTVTIQEYDLLDRPITERVEDKSGTLLLLSRYRYDYDGNKTHEISGESITQTAYNAQKKPTKIIDPLGNTTHITYNYHFINRYGQPVLQTIQTDPLGNQTLETLNAIGEIAEVTRKDPFGQVTAHKELFYDGIGNCYYSKERVITPGQPDRTLLTYWNYDGVGQLRTYIEAVGTPEQRTTTFLYNTKGQKETLIKPDGVKIHYSYDSKGRLASFIASDNSCGYSYTYNKNDAPLVITDLITHTQALRTYDTSDRLISEILANGAHLQYTYDQQGRLQKLTLPDQTAIRYQYNAAFLTHIERLDTSGKLLYTHQYLDYDLSGQSLHAQLPGKTGLLQNSYDLAQRQISISHPAWTQTDSKYDSAGNLTGYKIGSDSYQFTYDPLYQLSSEKDHSYTHDSISNRVVKDSAPHTLNPLNQLLHETDHDYQYDLSGNLIKEQTPTQKILYTYDALDRLVTVTKGTQQYRYIYDAFNRRLSKTTPEGTIHYIYQGDNEIGAFDSTGITELRLLGIGKGAEIGAAVAFELHNKLLVPLHDLSGNVTALLDPTGVAQETYRYTAFGEEQIFDGRGNAISTSQYNNSWRYSSKRCDPETGLVYFGRRYYNPRIGRWTAPDPLGLTAGPNLYAYVSNNPLTHIDLYGLFDDSLWDTPFLDRTANFSFLSNFTNSLWNGCGSSLHNLDRGMRQGRDNPFPNMDPSCNWNSLWEDEEPFAYNFGRQIGSFSSRADTFYASLHSNDGITALELPLGPGGLKQLARPLSNLFRFTKPTAIISESVLASETAIVETQIPSLDRLSRAGQMPDRKGFTKAGRALQKHGGRAGSAFYKPTGNQLRINELGQDVLDNILTHPESAITLKRTKRFGEVIDIMVPRLGGVRYTRTGAIIGFMEPPPG